MIKEAVVSKTVGVVGGGPAGLMAADILAAAGLRVTVFDAMPTVGRKFLMAGKSGLNLTHRDLQTTWRHAYSGAAGRLEAALDGYSVQGIRNWCQTLGVETFIGSSGRLFPKGMKASPLLRAWLGQLSDRGVTFATRHRLIERNEDRWLFQTPDGERTYVFAAVILAMGGASWPRLGSDASWVPWMAREGVTVAPFRPANSGFEVVWSDIFRERFSGTPVKAVTATSSVGTSSGEFVISQNGIEGGLVYAHSRALREQVEAEGSATWPLDLAPDRTVEEISRQISRQPHKNSLSNRLRKGAGLDAVKIGLLREFASPLSAEENAGLAHLIKALPLKVTGIRSIEEAISSAGGVAWSEVDNDYMLKRLPGVFVAGEMLDWEAPTGGYLLTACLATGRAAGEGAKKWLSRREQAADPA
ncbi:dehydrogenase [Devosia pacifica]|uniref:Dehydrogenase n=1 Tax=Devosia pacifica TaxID=1335967 RepID=A0A918RXF9_9HYPH|nr:TIGR03862 family flavoprotein [Devosia pacifica]GHA12383.1 dehydrogenase [Devosia pacifica]